MRLIHVSVLVAGLGLTCGLLRGSEFSANWGVDAILTCAVPKETVPEWLGLLKNSGVRILRERSTTRFTLDGTGGDFRPVYAQEKAAGFMVVGFGREIADLPGVARKWGLARDLGDVFKEGKRIGREYAAFVDAWELHNEPDVGYVPELPDRYTSHAKALFLGLKAGASEAGRETPVILGALALSPGPWWERSVANGMLDYADAYNFHFYGYAADLTSVIEAHRSALRELGAGSYERGAGSWLARKRGGSVVYDRSSPLLARSSKLSVGSRMLPFWITECGVNATAPGDFFNEQRRAFQTQFTVETARQALEAPDVAVFMPFILVHKGDPHALVVADNVAPLPAWDAYAQFTKDNPWPKRKLFEPAGERANPVVVQWLPAAGTLSHKVAGCYRVRDNEVLTGELRVYNFSERAVTGRWEAEAKSWKLRAKSSDLGAKSLELGAPITIAAGGCVAVPVSYQPKDGTGYFREWQTLRFHEETGRSSQVYFGVERVPAEGDFMGASVVLRRLEGGGRLQAPVVNVEGVAQGPWRVFNGLAVSELGARSLELGARSLQLTAHAGQRWRFSVGEANRDPLAPTYAVAAVAGVPKGAQFLRVKLDRPMSNEAFLRVDLVDTDGQRFTIWENLGNVYGETSAEVWLGLADFHPFFWSKAVPGERRLRPEKVSEVHLRVYLGKGGAMEVGLEWATARLPTKHTK